MIANTSNFLWNKDAYVDKFSIQESFLYITVQISELKNWFVTSKSDKQAG